MRAHLRLIAFAATSFALAASAQQSASLASGNAAPEPPPTRWYGWQIILADAATMGVAAVGASSGKMAVRNVAFGVHLATSPLIHAAHGEYERAGLAVVIRDAPLLAAALIANSCPHGSAECPSTGTVAVLGIALVAGAIVDWTALSWH